MTTLSAEIKWPNSKTDPIKFTGFTPFSLIQHLRQISENEVARAGEHKGRRFKFEVEVWSDDDDAG